MSVLKPSATVNTQETAAHTDGAIEAMTDAMPVVTDAGFTLDDFLAYMPGGGFIFTPTRDLWPASNVNASSSSTAMPLATVLHAK